MRHRITAAMFACVALSAHAAGALAVSPTSAAPIATTGNATSITTSSARMNGVIVTTASGSVWEFQYGSGTSYANETSAQQAGAGVHVVSVAVSGLRPGTQYHFRVIVREQAGAVRVGSDLTFTTPDPPTKGTLVR